MFPYKQPSGAKNRKQKNKEQLAVKKMHGYLFNYFVRNENVFRNDNEKNSIDDPVNNSNDRVDNSNKPIDNSSDFKNGFDK